MTATTLQRYYKVVAVYDKIIENEATHANWLLFCRHVGYTLLIPVMQRYPFGCFQEAKWLPMLPLLSWRLLWALVK